MTTRFLPIPWSSSRRGPGCTASLDERLYIDNRTLGLTSPSIHPWLEGWCPQIAAEAQRWIARPRHGEDGGRDPPPPPCPVWPARAPAHTPAGPKVNLAREGFKDRREKNSFLLTMEIELRSLTNTCCSFTATIREAKDEYFMYRAYTELSVLERVQPPICCHRSGWRQEIGHETRGGMSHFWALRTHRMGQRPDCRLRQDTPLD
jgi:hypothetical protein